MRPDRLAHPALIGLVATVLMILAPAVIYPIFLVKLLCFALFAAAFNLLIGYVGLLSFGHAAFFGTGAYIAAHLLAVRGATPEIALIAATLLSALLGLMIGALAVRRKGIYFAMITLALSQMVYFLYLQADFTGGEDGIQGVPHGTFLGVIDLNAPLALYYTVLGIVVIALLALWRFIHSPFGNILEAIRENEARAVSLGYFPVRYKLVAFTVSAALAGLAGALKAIALQIASLVDVTWQMSGEVVLMTLIGGIGTFSGPLVGAFAIGSLEHYLARSPVPAPVVIGLSFIVCVMLFRKGIVGTLNSWRARTSRPSAGGEPARDATTQENQPNNSKR